MAVCNFFFIVRFTNCWKICLTDCHLHKSTNESFGKTLAYRPVTGRLISVGSTDTEASASTINRVTHSSLATPYEGVLEDLIRVFQGIICTEELNLDTLRNQVNGVRYAKSEENMG